MRITKVAFIIAGGLILGTVGPRLAGSIFGEGNAFLIVFGAIALWGVASFLIDRYNARNGHKNTDISPPPESLPKHLQELGANLSKLGFRPVATVTAKQLFKQHKLFTYTNRSRNIFAYLRPEEGGYVTFSCYLRDGLDISTNYKQGVPMESEKLIIKVVKTSLSAALDFHKHHVRNQARQHGPPKQFKNYREVLDWETEQEYNIAVHQEATKLNINIWLRLALAAFLIIPVIGVGLTVLMVLVTNFLGIIPPYRVIIPGISILSIVLALVWVYRPLYAPETVESRKKKTA
jgi:hypothetical protein